MKYSSKNAQLNEPEYSAKNIDLNPSDSRLTPEEAHWEKMFQILVEFKNTHNHCLGPLNHKENIFLWKWIEGLRKNRYTLEGDRKKRLNELGFSWTVYEVMWEKKFLKLCEFKNKYGHCDIPSGFKDDPPLANWVSAQRWGQKNLKTSQKRKLTSIGFTWSILNIKWETNFLKLIEYKKMHGHCNVPQLYKEDCSLGAWVAEQRHNIDACWFTERKKRLDEIGFTWNRIEELWEKQFQKLLEFKAKHGHFQIPKNGDLSFRDWIKTQRVRRNTLDLDKKKKLNEIGFIWSPHETLWEENFKNLLEFKNLNGHCNVSFKEPTLRNWSHKQRRDKINLDSSQIQRLDDIGFIWKIKDSDWEKAFSRLIEFKKNYGHCNVPYEYPDDPFLGLWVSRQRMHINKYVFADKKKRLDEIGLDWHLPDEAWDKYFKILQDFTAKNGHCKLSENCDPNFRNWVSKQRKDKKNLDHNKIKKLDAIGFSWAPNEQYWEKNFLKLVEFQKIHGHCNVPRQYESDTALGIWINNQRAKKESLEYERKKRLDELGFNWTTRNRKKTA